MTNKTQLYDEYVAQRDIQDFRRQVSIPTWYLALLLSVPVSFTLELAIEVQEKLTVDKYGNLFNFVGSEAYDLTRATLAHNSLNRCEYTFDIRRLLYTRLLEHPRFGIDFPHRVAEIMDRHWRQWAPGAAPHMTHTYRLMQWSSKAYLNPIGALEDLQGWQAMVSRPENVAMYVQFEKILCEFESTPLAKLDGFTALAEETRLAVSRHLMR